MKLKEGIKFEIQDKDYVFDFSNVKVKKVTSRLFPILLNKNEYNGVGFGVLDRVGFLEQEQIDEYYMIRGEIGEILVHEYLIQAFKSKGIDIITKHFKTKEVEYDLFKRNERFGGVIDIGISSPEKVRSVVEVKSKSLKDLEKIEEGKGILEEVLQGKFLTRLAQVSKLLMGYVFFEQAQEGKIKMMITRGIRDANEIIKQLDLNIRNVKIKIYPHAINEAEIDDLMETSYNNLHRIVKLGKINKIHFSFQEQQYLNNLIKDSGVKPKNISQEEWDKLGLIF